MANLVAVLSTRAKAKVDADTSLQQLNLISRCYGLFLPGWSKPGAYKELVVEAQRRIESQ